MTSSTKHISVLRIVTYVLVAVGTALNLLFIIPNGSHTCISGTCGITIGEWHYHDALWHIAVARNSFMSYPFVYPSASGFSLVSYNYFLGLMMFLLEIFRIGPFFSYFKLLPLVGNLGLIYTLLRYCRLTKKSDIQQLWIVFFTYFGSSFSYLLIVYRHNFEEFSILKGFPVVATLQPSFVLSNVQFFLTLSLFFYILTDVILHRHSVRRTLFHGLLLSLCVGLKIYSGITLFALLVMGIFVSSIRQRAYGTLVINQIIIVLSFIISSILFYLPSAGSTTTFPFAWSPFSIPHTITEAQGLFYDKNFTLGRYYLYGIGKFSLRLIFFEFISAFLFILWNLGTRSIVVYSLITSIIKKSVSFEWATLFTIGLIGMVMPILYIQVGGGWYNSIQFAYLAVYAFGILAALTVADWLKRPSVFPVLGALVVVILTLPNNILTFRLLSKEKILISDKEIMALGFLKNQPKGVVLSFPDDKNSSYVPALSYKVGYMIDYEQADLLSLPIKKRVKRIEDKDCSILHEIDYLYIQSSKGLSFVRCRQFPGLFTRIYKDSPIYIYKKNLILR